MSNKNLFRIGAGAAIVGFLIMFGGESIPPLIGVGVLLWVVFYYAMYRCLDGAPLALAGLLVGAAGAVVTAFLTIVQGTITGNLYILAVMCAMFLPALFLGLATGANLPRALAILGIIGGILGAANATIVVAGGGNQFTPNNPAFEPWIMGTYYAGSLAVTIWLIWSSIALVRKA